MPNMVLRSAYQREEPVGSARSVRTVVTLLTEGNPRGTAGKGARGMVVVLGNKGTSE